MLATLSSKGQLTLPKPAREALGLTTGQQFLVKISDAGSLVLTPQRSNPLSVRGLLKSPLAKALTAREMDAGLAKHLRAKHVGLTKTVVAKANRSG